MRSTAAAIVILLAVAGCGSTGSVQPLPTGAEGQADSIICFNFPDGTLQISNAEANASPDLVTLVDEWKTANGDAEMGVDGAVAKAAQYTAAIAAWCSGHSSTPPASHAPAVSPAQCAAEMRAWLATNDGGGDAAGPPTVRHDLSEAITAAKDYARRSPDSPDAAGDEGTEGAEFGRLSNVPDPPACADPTDSTELWWQALLNNISAAGGSNGDSDVAYSMQSILSDVQSINGELRHTAPGVQIRA